ncbi:MAG: HAD-IIA family hydrolase [Chloroflexota bacterium]|nr:HAD-IIA family hydrolase [Chloroflexota bacterium]
MRKLANIKGMIIDMDGVLWRGRTFLEGVPGFFSFLRTSSMPFLLVTNNSTATPESVVERMDGAGVQIDPAEVLTSSLATAAHLAQKLPSGTTIYAIGEDALKGALCAAGFRLVDSADGVQAVVMGFDREISWAKMTEASIAIQSGALFIATNPDLSFPIERGQAPGAGAFITAVKLTTGVEPLIIGKPEPRLFNLAREHLGLTVEQILSVGDRLETDILGAQRAGIATGLLLTGVTSSDQAEASTIKPDWIFDDLPSLTRELARAHE